MTKKSIPSNVTQIPESYVYLSPIAKGIFGISSEDKDDERPYLALKYFSPSHQCFSEWSKTELKAFSSFTEKLKKVNWRQVRELGGFGYKVHKDRNILPGKGSAIKEISLDIPPSELRITQRARIHGFRMNSAFFLVWLDKDHQMYPE